MKFPGKRFKSADVFQQVAGGFLFAGPFIVEGGVWDMAKTMGNLQAGLLVLLVMYIGYAALYKADRNRDVSGEITYLGVPARFISLMLVSYGSIVVLVLLLSGPQTYNATTVETLRQISIAAVFSVIGAAAADSVL